MDDKELLIVMGNEGWNTAYVSERHTAYRSSIRRMYSQDHTAYVVAGGSWVVLILLV
jgi:hypothetical protein